MTDEDLGGWAAGEREVPEIDTRVPHGARMYDYILGGKDNFEADRLELVPPGLVQLSKWRPDSEAESQAVAGLWAGLARKP